MEALGANEKTSTLVDARAEAKPEISRRKKRQSVLRRHFPKRLVIDAEEESPMVIQEEPALPVSPRGAPEGPRALSTGRMMPLRRRTDVTNPAPLSRRREGMLIKLAEKKQRSDAATKNDDPSETTEKDTKETLQGAGGSQADESAAGMPNVRTQRLRDRRRRSLSVSRSKLSLQGNKDANESASVQSSAAETEKGAFATVSITGSNESRSSKPSISGSRLRHRSLSASRSRDSEPQDVADSRSGSVLEASTKAVKAAGQSGLGESGNNAKAALAGEGTPGTRRSRQIEDRQLRRRSLSASRSRKLAEVPHEVKGPVSRHKRSASDVPKAPVDDKERPPKTNIRARGGQETSPLRSTGAIPRAAVASVSSKPASAADDNRKSLGVQSSENQDTSPYRSKQDRLQRCNKHRRSLSSSRLPKLDTDPQDTEERAQGSKESDAFDMRSIVDDPPEPIRMKEERVAMAEDPSWDTARVYFNEFDRGENRNEVDLFDADAWIATDMSFPSVAGDTDLASLQEEKKEKEPANVQPVRQVGVVPLTDDTLDSLGWPVQQDAFFPNTTGLASEDVFGNREDDNENLLVGSSDSPLHGGDEVETNVSKEARIGMYTTVSRDEMSDADDSDGSEFDDSDEEVGYVSQADADDQDDEPDQAVAVEPFIDGRIVEDFATFDIAADAVTAGDSGPAVVKEERLADIEVVEGFANFDFAVTAASEIDKKATCVGDTEASKLLSVSVASSKPPQNGMNTAVPVPPPPPPPPQGSKKKRSNKRESQGSTGVPLLAPPPEDRLKKWEESKLKPLKHLQAVKSEQVKKLAVETEGISFKAPSADSADASQLEASALSVLPDIKTRSNGSQVSGAAVSVPRTDPSVDGGSATSRAAEPLVATSETKKADEEDALETRGVSFKTPSVDSAETSQLEAGALSILLDIEERPSGTQDVTVAHEAEPKKDGLMNAIEKTRGVSFKAPSIDSAETSQLEAGALSILLDIETQKSDTKDETVSTNVPWNNPSQDTGDVSELEAGALSILLDMETKQMNTNDIPGVTDVSRENPSLDSGDASGTDAGALTILLDMDMELKQKTTTEPGPYPSSQRNRLDVETVDSADLNGLLSPASSAAVIHDTKMAEKVDQAISAAAFKFEEQLEEKVAVSRSTPAAKLDSDHSHESVPAHGGAFRTWENAKQSGANAQTPDESVPSAAQRPADAPKSRKRGRRWDPSEAELISWLLYDVLRDEKLASSVQQIPSNSPEEASAKIRFLLEDEKRFNAFCRYISDRVNTRTTELRVTPFSLPKKSDPAYARVLATDFVRYFDRISQVSRVPSPFGTENPFLAQKSSSERTTLQAGRPNEGAGEKETVQSLVFDHPLGGPREIVGFAFRVNLSIMSQLERLGRGTMNTDNATAQAELHAKLVSKLSMAALTGPRSIVPDGHPSPFETLLRTKVKLLSSVLDFLGDPVAVCRMKMVNKTCYRYVDQNEHVLIRDAVRLGGLSVNARPAFWMWVTLEKSADSQSGRSSRRQLDLTVLERQGREGKWNHVIERDVSRAFGTLPPHKTGARLRTDSIVRALVTWGKSRMLKRGVKGSGDPPPASHTGSREEDSDDVSLTPTDTVSDWGGVSPTGSFAASSFSGPSDKPKPQSKSSTSTSTRQTAPDENGEEMALGGNALTDEMKRNLQDKLSCILNALAAAHGDVGYCQGMDYVVAHLLRHLQETVRWQAVRGKLPSVIKSAPQNMSYGPHVGEQEMAEQYAEIDQSLVVEETCFRVMDAFLTTYDLRHFYWPELRCLKTCCLVFEKLIHVKLPVLADHFEHHELNVGLFALGWFQTLFLYLPSMPSATVCHMWDIWLVERSFKIFFRVATAILFLSQPILLNHELEGMMTYLNTFPDSTLLNPDILIACALQIKVTNSMLMQLEREVSEQL